MSKSGFVPRALLAVGTAGGSEMAIRSKEAMDRDAEAKKLKAQDRMNDEMAAEDKRLKQQADDDKYASLVGQSSLTYRRGRSANMLSNRSASRGLLGL